jgi:hypothetical protein
MRSKAVLVTLALSFVAPMFVAAANAAEPGTVQASSHDSSCRRKRAKKSEGESTKKKDKDGKKSYGFEL